LTAGPLRLDGNEGPLTRDLIKSTSRRAHVPNPRSIIADVLISATSATSPSPTTPPERPSHLALRRKPTTPNDAPARAESVSLTDVPLEAGGRAYLVERGLEEEGSNANAALHALIADYLHQASVLDAVPMAEGHGRR
jgi:hypothetical protein